MPSILYGSTPPTSMITAVLSRKHYGTAWCFRKVPERGPATILFISCHTCSDRIAKLFRACFYERGNWGWSHNCRATSCIFNGVSYRRACVRLSARGVAGNLPLKVSRNIGYRSDGIAISCDMGPLSLVPLATRTFPKLIGKSLH